MDSPQRSLFAPKTAQGGTDNLKGLSSHLESQSDGKEGIPA